MLVRLYFLTWIALILVASVMWIAGVLNMFTSLVVGALALTLVFSGIIAVLPSTFHTLLKH